MPDYCRCTDFIPFRLHPFLLWIQGYTPLFMAVVLKKVNEVKRLIECKANIKSADNVRDLCYISP